MHYNGYDENSCMVAEMWPDEPYTVWELDEDSGWQKRYGYNT